jgi:hypothetical protein
VGQIEKPHLITPQQKVATPQKPSMTTAARDAAREAIKTAIFEKRPYLRMAFSNPYNLSLFLGTMGAAVVTLNPILALVALGAEGLWLLHGPESKTLRRILWDPRFEKIRLALEDQERGERIKDLPQQEKDRVNALVAKEQEINKLAAQNPSFTGDLLRTELVKTRRLVEAFVEMALTCGRYERYLDTVDLNALERDRERWRVRASADRAGDQERDIAKKNLAVIEKRLEKLRDIRSYLGVARAQLDLIENSFQLIADQIVTMQSPTELSGQLDDLVDGVESIQQTARDTEKILNTLEV